jgi:LysR family nitrogen assimilation transcriptional regulator
MNAFNSLVRVPGTSLQSDARERPFDLRELRYFYSVACTGNFGRSARELNISQPAISHQVRKLEEGLGTQLLMRHGRGVALTPAGACLRDRIDTIMQLLATPLHAAAGEGPEARSVSLAVSAEIAPLLIAPLARRLRARWPDVALNIREGSGTEVEEWVLHHRVDMAVTHDPPNVAELQVDPILGESLGMVAPVQARVAEHQRPIRLRDLAGEPLILPGSRHWIRRRIESAARQHGLYLNPALQVNSVASTKAMVRNGLGCAILPLTAVQDEVDRGALAFRPICHPDLSSICAIVFRRSAPGPLIADFADLAREAMTDLVEQGAWSGAQIIKSIRKQAVAEGGSQDGLAPLATVAEELAI